MINVIQKFPEIPVPAFISLSWYLHKSHIIDVLIMPRIQENKPKRHQTFAVTISHKSYLGVHS